MPFERASLRFLLRLLPLAGILAGVLQKQALQAAQDDQPRKVTVEAGPVADVRRQVDVVGTLAAREEVVVSAEVAGRVARLVHDLGDRVAAGGALIELDPEKLQYRADGQRAALDQARARYGAVGDGDAAAARQGPGRRQHGRAAGRRRSSSSSARRTWPRGTCCRSQISRRRRRVSIPRRRRTTRRSRRRGSSAPTSRRSPRRCGLRSASCATR